MLCRLRGRDADTNFPIENYPEELAAVDTQGVHAETAFNSMRETQRNKASKYRGVCLSAGKYVAQLTVDKKHHYLGLFATEIEAAQAYDRCSSECLNHPTFMCCHASTIPKEWTNR